MERYGFSFRTFLFMSASSSIISRIAFSGRRAIHAVAFHGNFFFDDSWFPEKKPRKIKKIKIIY